MAARQAASSSDEEEQASLEEEAAVLSSSDMEGLDGEAARAQRVQGSKGAGSSGRDAVLEETSRARVQSDERLGLPIYTLDPKVAHSSRPMMEVEAGSNIWYQAHVLKESKNEMRVLFPAPSPEEEERKEWVRKDSSRIWRGPIASRFWTYIDDGAWRPKEGPKGKRRGRVKAGRGGRPAKSASQAPADGTSGSGAVESDAEEYGSSQGQRVQTPPGEAQAALKHEVSGDVAMLDAPEPAIPQPQPQHQAEDRPPDGGSEDALEDWFLEHYKIMREAAHQSVWPQELLNNPAICAFASRTKQGFAALPAKRGPEDAKAVGPAKLARPSDTQMGSGRARPTTSASSGASISDGLGHHLKPFSPLSSANDSDDAQPEAHRKPSGALEPRWGWQGRASAKAAGEANSEQESETNEDGPNSRTSSLPITSGEHHHEGDGAKPAAERPKKASLYGLKKLTLANGRHPEAVGQPKWPLENGHADRATKDKLAKAGHRRDAGKAGSARLLPTDVFEGLDGNK